MGMLRIASLGLLVGCTSESWVYAPTASESLTVEEGTTVVEGQAVLTYDSAGFPDMEEVVSNALRLEVKPRREAWVLEFPEADPDQLGTFERSNALNLHEVYQPCEQAQCEVVVPFRITREQTSSSAIEVSGDAILSIESLAHRTTPESDAATLEVLF
jgi:hypothetical protein